MLRFGGRSTKFTLLILKVLQLSPFFAPIPFYFHLAISLVVLVLPQSKITRNVHHLRKIIPIWALTCMTSGQIMLFRQPRFPWNKGISLTKPPFGVRSCDIAMIRPDDIINFSIFFPFPNSIIFTSIFCPVTSHENPRHPLATWGTEPQWLRKNARSLRPLHQMSLRLRASRLWRHPGPKIACFKSSCCGNGKMVTWVGENQELPWTSFFRVKLQQRSPNVDFGQCWWCVASGVIRFPHISDTKDLPNLARKPWEAGTFAAAATKNHKQVPPRPRESPKELGLKPSPDIPKAMQTVYGDNHFERGYRDHVNCKLEGSQCVSATLTLQLLLFSSYFIVWVSKSSYIGSFPTKPPQIIDIHFCDHLGGSDSTIVCCISLVEIFLLWCCCDFCLVLLLDWLRVCCWGVVIVFLVVNLGGNALFI